MPKVFWFDNKDMDKMYGKFRILKGSYVQGACTKWNGMIVIHLNTAIRILRHRTLGTIEILGHEYIHYLAEITRATIVDRILDYISYGWKKRKE